METEEKAYYAVWKDFADVGVVHIGFRQSGKPPFIFYGSHEKQAALLQDWSDLDAMSNGKLFEMCRLVEAPIEVMRDQMAREEATAFH